MDNYSKLLEFCQTERQTEILKTIIDVGSINRAFPLLGITRQAVQNTLKVIKKNARLRGYDPEADMTRPSGEGLGLKRVSTNYNEDGDIRQQWVIFEPGKEQQGQQLIEFCEGLKQEIKPAKKPNHPRVSSKKNCCPPSLSATGTWA